MFIKRSRPGRPLPVLSWLKFSLSAAEKLAEREGGRERRVKGSIIRFMKVNIATSAPTSLDKVEYWKCGPMKEARERERV